MNRAHEYGAGCSITLLAVVASESVRASVDHLAVQTNASARGNACAWALIRCSRIVQVDQAANQQEARADDLTCCCEGPSQPVLIGDSALVSEVRERIGSHCPRIATQVSAAHADNKSSESSAPRNVVAERYTHIPQTGRLPWQNLLP